MPNLKHNAYRDSLVAHQTTANEYYMDMCGDDGMSNPCSSTTKTISDGAWVSPSADKWCTHMETLGKYIKDSFDLYSVDVSDAVAAEPEDIDVDTDTDNTWKVDWVAPATW